MKLIIDIPEEVYKKVKETHDVMCDNVWLGIKNGIPLEDIETEILEKMADYVASGYADSAEDFEEYSRIICQTFNKHIGGKE